MSGFMFFFWWGWKLKGENKDSEAVARCENEKRGGNVLHRLNGGESGNRKPSGNRRCDKRGNGEKVNEKIHSGKGGEALRWG
jgi:hypothetical protein